MKSFTLIVAVSVMACASPPPLRAQGVGAGLNGGFDVRCAQAVRTSSASRAPHRQATELDILPGCGSEGARETVRAIMATRSEQNTAALASAWRSINRWRDADVMGAALAVARDKEGSTRSRVFATMHLIGLLHPGWLFTYDGIVRGATYHKEGDGLVMEPGCGKGISGTHANTFVTPLPADYPIQIQTLLTRMSEDVSLPKELRNAAACGT